MELPHGLPQTWGEPCDIRQLQAAVSWSYDSLAKGDLHHPLRLGAWQIGRNNSIGMIRKCCSASAICIGKQMVGAAFPKSDAMRWQGKTCQRIHVTLVICIDDSS